MHSSTVHYIAGDRKSKYGRHVFALSDRIAPDLYLIGSRLMRFLVAGVGALLLAVQQSGVTTDFSRGDDRLGLAAPPFELKNWLHSPPLEMQALRGKGVLVRWWTEGCPFCVATAPALRQLDRKYAARGLAVIGVFHPKPPGDWSLGRMRMASDRLGVSFPVALAEGWSALGP